MKKLLRMALFAALPLAAMMMFSSYSGSFSGVCPPGNDLGPTVLLPNPDNCSTFFMCSNGVPILMHCPDGLHFNDELDVCEWPRDAGCADNNGDGSGGGGGNTTKRLKTVSCKCSNGRGPSGKSLRCRSNGDLELCTSTMQGSNACYSVGLSGMSLKCEGGGSIIFEGE